MPREPGRELLPRVVYANASSLQGTAVIGAARNLTELLALAREHEARLAYSMAGQAHSVIDHLSGLYCRAAPARSCRR